LLEKVLAAHRRTAEAAGVNWKAAIYHQVREEVSSQRWPSERLCALAGASRRGFYRFDPDRDPVDQDMERRDAIQRTALEMPSYGRPRITAELRRGWIGNAKRAHRIMREGNLLCLRRRKFLVTAKARRGWPVVPKPLLDDRVLWS
jgi:HTH-like domain